MEVTQNAANKLNSYPNLDERLKELFIWLREFAPQYLNKTWEWVVSFLSSIFRLTSKVSNASSKTATFMYTPSDNSNYINEYYPYFGSDF